MTNATNAVTAGQPDREAIRMLTGSFMSHLRSIKDVELRWLEFYSVLVLPAIGFLVALRHDDPNNPDLSSLAVGIIVFAYFVLTVWIQLVLQNERRSYYVVLLQVVRAENYLGLFESLGFLGSLRRSPFPEGWGPTDTDGKRVDGTERTKTFTYRNMYTFVLLLGLCLSGWYNNEDASWVGIVCCLADAVCLLAYIYPKDVGDMIDNVEKSRGLLGWDPQWDPVPGTRTNDHSTVCSG